MRAGKRNGFHPRNSAYPSSSEEFTTQINNSHHYVKQPSVTQYHWFVYEEDDKDKENEILSNDKPEDSQELQIVQPEYPTDYDSVIKQVTSKPIQVKPLDVVEHEAFEDISSDMMGPTSYFGGDSYTMPILPTTVSPIQQFVTPDSYLPYGYNNNYGYDYGDTPQYGHNGWPSLSPQPSKRQPDFLRLLNLLGPILFPLPFMICLIPLIIPAIPLALWSTHEAFHPLLAPRPNQTSVQSPLFSIFNHFTTTTTTTPPPSMASTTTQRPYFPEPSPSIEPPSLSPVFPSYQTLPPLFPTLPFFPPTRATEPVIKPTEKPGEEELPSRIYTSPPKSNFTNLNFSKNVSVTLEFVTETPPSNLLVKIPTPAARVKPRPSSPPPGGLFFANNFTEFPLIFLNNTFDDLRDYRREQEEDNIIYD